MKYVKKSDRTNVSMFPCTPGSSPRSGERKVNTRVNSIASTSGLSEREDPPLKAKAFSPPERGFVFKTSRRFPNRVFGLLLISLLLLSLFACSKKEPVYEFDLVIVNGNVVDGSGALWFPADVAISRDKIVRVGRIAEKEKRGRRIIDAKGLTVSPGFIDI